jgi:hypothetical protein
MWLGLIPRLGRFTLPVDATLGEIEAEVKGKWDLGTIETEFALVDPISGSNRRVPNSTKLSDINHDQYELFLRPAGTQDYLGDDDGGNVEASDGESRAMASVHVTVPRVVVRKSEGEVQLRFKIPQRGDGCEVTLGFSKKATVKEARKKVANHLGVSIDAITLLLAGKPLREQFVLHRLRAADQAITVYVREIAEILLVTAKGVRRPPKT